MTLIEKKLALENLAKKMEVELVYDLAKSAQKCVPGEGNPDAEILFIGEAPGRDEDVSGRPFVGRSGNHASC